jgi:hypothetical protein
MLNFEVNRRIKASLPPEDWKRIMYVSGGANLNLQPAALGIQIDNSYMAYPFLVDNNARFWWRAVGKASKKDLIQMCQVYDRLAKREATPASVYDTLLSELLKPNKGGNNSAKKEGMKE